MKQKLLDLYNRLKAGVLRTLSANVINRVISMLSSMAITRLLSQNDYGIWGYVLNLYSYLVLVTGFGLVSGALQFGTENKGKGKAYNYFKYCTKNGLLINLMIIIAFGTVISFFHLPIEGAKPFVIIVLPFLLLEYIVSMGQMVLRSQNRINEYANVLNVNTILITVGTCGGAFLGIKGVVAGRYLANFITITYLYSLLRKDLIKIRDAKELEHIEKKGLWHYSIFTGISSAMNCLVYSLDITLIASLIKNATDVGVYKVGSLIPNALQFIPNSIVIAILPNVIYNRKDISWVRKNVKKTYFALVVMNAIIVLILILAAPLIIHIISGEKYLSSVPVLRVLALGYFFSGTFRNLSVNLLCAFRRVHFGLFISAISCVLDIGLNYWLILTNGMIGAAYATLFVDIITAAISFIYVVVLLLKGTINENS